MYSRIDDIELDQLVHDAVQEHSEIGIRMLKGYLQGKGHRVLWQRVREALLRTDPIGLLQRWKRTVRRRHYYVKYLLSLWHIDRNHMLIRCVKLLYVQELEWYNIILTSRAKETANSGKHLKKYWGTKC